MKSARSALAIPLFAVAFGTNVSTPLLLIYKTDLNLSTFTVAALFAVYPLGLAPALAYSGPASDVLGRRRIMIPGLVLSALSSLVMMGGSRSLVLLFVGRTLLGAVSGMVFVVASAWVQEISADNPMWAARFTGLVVYTGFALGPLTGGILGEWAPFPLVLPFLVHVGLVAAGLRAIRSVPETVHPRVGRTITPRLGIPAGSGAMFMAVVVPTSLGVFGFVSLAFGLFPVLLQPAMASIAVFASGLMGGLAMGSIVPMQALVGRIGPFRSAPLGLMLGTLGCLLGTVAFVTGAWPVLFPASILMGAGSGLSITAGLRFVDLMADPADRGALTGVFYAVAYAGMTMPVIVAIASGPSGYPTVLALLTGLGLLGSIWLGSAARKAARLVAI